MSKVCQNLYQQNVVLAQLIIYSFFGKKTSPALKW